MSAKFETWYRRTWVRFEVPTRVTDEELAQLLRDSGLNVTEGDFEVRRKGGVISGVILAVPREVVADLVNEKLAKISFPTWKGPFKTKAEAAAVPDGKPVCRDEWPPKGVVGVTAYGSRVEGE